MNLRKSWISSAVAVLLLIILSEYASALPSVPFEGNNVENNELISDRSSSADNGNWNVMMRILEECAEKDVMSCLGVKAVAAIERTIKMADIQVFDGLSLVKSPDFVDDRNGRALMSEEELQNSIDQDPNQKTSRLVEYLLDAAARFFKSHLLQFKFPKFSPEEVQRAFEEARGKKKIIKMILPIIMLVAAKMALIIPLGIGLVGFLALKALLVSKLALIIAGVVALQKFFGGGGFGGLGGKNGWPSGGSSGWNTGGVGSGWSNAGSGGWSSSGSGSSAGYYRSFDSNTPVDAHQMAYKAQTPQ